MSADKLRCSGKLFAESRQSLVAERRAKLVDDIKHLQAQSLSTPEFAGGGVALPCSHHIIRIGLGFERFFADFVTSE